MGTLSTRILRQAHFLSFSFLSFPFLSLSGDFAQFTIFISSSSSSFATFFSSLPFDGGALVRVFAEWPAEAADEEPRFLRKLLGRLLLLHTHAVPSLPENSLCKLLPPVSVPYIASIVWFHAWIHRFSVVFLFPIFISSCGFLFFMESRFRCLMTPDFDFPLFGLCSTGLEFVFAVHWKTKARRGRSWRSWNCRTNRISSDEQSAFQGNWPPIWTIYLVLVALHM